MHANKDVVREGGTVDDCGVADDTVGANGTRRSGVGMNHCIVLILVLSPMRMVSVSPLRTAPNQSEASASMVTSPMAVALGATKALG